MKYLVDSNVWLEVFLQQAKAAEANSFLTSVNAADLAITDFAVQSILLKLTRLKLDVVALRFASDLNDADGVNLISLIPTQLQQVMTLASTTGLDYDDAYQYVAAELIGARIVTFDRDFDVTPRGSLSPTAARADARRGAGGIP